MALLYDTMGNVIGDDGSDPVEITQVPPGITSWGGENFSAADRGDVNDSNVGYFQSKIDEFQQTLFAVDAAASALENMSAFDVTADQYALIESQLSEYYTRKAAFKYAAEALNAVASAVNSMGGSMGSVTIPTGLGFAPLVIPVAYAAAITGAAVLIGWAINWLSTSQTLAADIASRISDPVKRDAALAEASKIAAANAAAGGSLGQVANVVKWIAIGAGVLLIFKMIEGN
jgi:hypothetical protein